MVLLSKEKKKGREMVLAYNCGDTLREREREKTRIYVGFSFTKETILVSSAIITSKLIRLLFLIKYLLFV